MVTMSETEPPSIVVYHAFTDNKDLWTRDYKFARKLYNHWKKANGAARLYKEVYENEEALLSDEMLDEDCLLTYGPYPL
jgi:hypothetical protein